MDAVARVALPACICRHTSAYLALAPAARLGGWLLAPGRGRHEHAGSSAASNHWGRKAHQPWCQQALLAQVHQATMVHDRWRRLARVPGARILGQSRARVSGCHPPAGALKKPEAWSAMVSVWPQFNRLSNRSRGVRSAVSKSSVIRNAGESCPPCSFALSLCDREFAAGCYSKIR